MRQCSTTVQSTVEQTLPLQSTETHYLLRQDGILTRHFSVKTHWSTSTPLVRKEGQLVFLSNWTTKTQGPSTSKSHVAGLVTKRLRIVRVLYFLDGFIHALKLCIMCPSFILYSIYSQERTDLSSGNVHGLKGFREDFLLNSNEDILLR